MKSAGAEAAFARSAYSEAVQAFDAATAAYRRFEEAPGRTAPGREAAARAREQAAHGRQRAEGAEAPQYAREQWDAAEASSLRRRQPSPATRPRALPRSSTKPWPPTVEPRKPRLWPGSANACRPKRLVRGRAKPRYASSGGRPRGRGTLRGRKAPSPKGTSSQPIRGPCQEAPATVSRRCLGPQQVRGNNRYPRRQQQVLGNRLRCHQGWAGGGFPGFLGLLTVGGLAAIVVGASYWLISPDSARPGAPPGHGRAYHPRSPASSVRQGRSLSAEPTRTVQPGPGALQDRPRLGSEGEPTKPEQRRSPA